uniref:Uncharacterized protein n=1 Tax=Avena sativa TaxID=4498 RepID=A0ACD5W477_AVESA
MARISAAPVHPDSSLRRPLLQNAPPPPRCPRFSIGPPQQRHITKAGGRQGETRTGRAAETPRHRDDDAERGMGRKGRNNPNAAAIARLKEEKLMHVTTLLEQFRASDEQVYTFEPNLKNGERAAIHSMCRKMGMISKSSGSGAGRCLSVYKCNNKNKQEPVDKEGPSRLGFSEEATQVLLDLFTHYPPDDAELNGDAVKNSGDKAAKTQWKKDSAFCRPDMHKDDIVKKVEMLTSKINGQIVEDRSKLPISSFKDRICSTLENHQVVLISGETGCGKTTQVPQYILDHVWGKGESCKIVCTQPRRISAVSVAERISAERGEPVGDTVGYKIRLESKGGKNSSIMFCTNGVLLRVLIGRVTNAPEAENAKHLFDDAIMGITHIIVDEIHERDRFSDFMLAILRDLLPMYPHLHIVLMSATIDADRFSQYFNGCPVIEVPGHTYPVKTFYLEDVLSILQSVDDNHLHPATDDLELNSVLTEEYKSSMDEVISMAMVNDEFDPLIELISVEQRPEVFNYSHSNTGIISAVLMAGAYPMVGQLLSPRKNSRRAVVETASGGKVGLHPHSLNFNLSINRSSGNPLIIYDEITRGDGGMYIKNCSVVGSYPLLLFAKEMAVAPPDDDSEEEERGSSEDEAENNTSGQQKEEIMSSPDNTVSVVVDRWLKFQATALDVAQIYCLRERLASAILFKVKHPQDALPPALGATMYAIACILSYDGLPAMVPSKNRASDQSSTERRVGYTRPNGFLTSLLSGIVIPPNAPQFHKSSNHPGGASEGRGSPDVANPTFESLTGGSDSEHILPPRADGRYNLRSRTGPGSAAPQSFKRQRDRRKGPE